MDENVLQTVAIWHPFCNWLGSMNPGKRLHSWSRPFHLAWTCFQICGKRKLHDLYIYILPVIMNDKKSSMKNTFKRIMY